MSRKKNTERARQKNYSTLKEHQVQGKTLIPPFLAIQQLQPISWINNRLPEMLWAALLLSQLPRPWALGIFREVAEYVGPFRDASPPYDITHTGLSKQPPGCSPRDFRHPCIDTRAERSLTATPVAPRASCQRGLGGSVAHDNHEPGLGPLDDSCRSHARRSVARGYRLSVGSTDM